MYPLRYLEDFSPSRKLEERLEDPLSQQEWVLPAFLRLDSPRFL